MQVTIAERNSERQRTLRADYVVGCDGSRSLVRQPAGITQTLSDHDRLMVLLVFRSTGLHRLLERFPGKSFYNVLHPDLQGYWQFFGRVDLGTTWFFHAPVPPGTTKDNFDFRRLLYAAVGEEFDFEFEHIGFWDLRFAIADHYRIGPRLHRRRCRAQPSALWRLRHQYRPRRCRESRLETCGGAARLGRRGTAGYLRRGAAAGVRIDRAGLHREGHRERQGFPGRIRSRDRQGCV